jgi:hypothetical protein
LKALWRRPRELTGGLQKYPWQEGPSAGNQSKKNCRAALPIGNPSTCAAAGRNLLAVVALINVCYWHVAAFAATHHFVAYWAGILNYDRQLRRVPRSSLILIGRGMLSVFNPGAPI